MVTIWRPSEDLRLALTEGSHFSIRYLLAAGFRNECLQFTAVRQTRWEPVMEGPPASSPEFDRCVTPLCLLSSGELNPLWKEVDVAGVVLRVGLLNKGLQLVHIVDHHINILTLKFWGGLKEYGVENIVAIGSVICVLNGNWRGHAGGRFGSIHVTELTFITSSPRSAHLLEAVAHLKNSIKELVHHESTDISKQAERDGTTDQKPLCAVNGEDTINPKMKRLQQRSQEIRSKLKVLGQYRTPSSLRRLHSPPTVGARKLFQAPFKQPQIFDGK
ncbi:breast cancer type 2 susceptibility protein-like, partial [Homarus americanus]